MDKRLLDILCCPVSKTPVRLASRGQLDAVNRAIGAGTVQTVAGTGVDARLEEALVAARRQEPTVKSRPPLRVSWADGRPCLQGFFFGVGAPVKATNLAQKTHKVGLFHNVAVAVTIATATLGALFGGARDEWREGVPAKLSLDGINITSASNSVSGAIDGVTINLAAAGSTTLTVSRDNSAATKAVQGFVDAYNSYVKTVGTLSSYDKDTGQAGILLGDTTLNSVQRQIGSVLSGKVAGNSIGSLASLGITRSADGSLAVDNAKLAATLDSNPSAVQDLFAGSNGYAKRLNTALDGFTASGGIISTRQQSLTDSLSKLNTQQSQLDARMSVYEKQLRDQYTQLDTLVSSLNNTSSYLTGALAQLEATYTKKS